MIRLRVLGPVDLRADEVGELRTILAQPKRLALLVALVVGPPGFRRRDSLLALLWPELDLVHARSALNQAVRFLRKEMGDPAGTIIVSRGTDELGVAAGGFWCDAMALREHVEEGRFREALDLYRGDLLVGFFADHGAGFDEWLDRERVLLRLTAAKAARLVAGLHEQSGDLTPAVAAARRAVELADADERVVRELMQLLDRHGDRAGAIQAFEEFAHRLSTEFGASPAPETRLLIEQIRKRGSAVVSGVAPPASALHDGRRAPIQEAALVSTPRAVHPFHERSADVTVRADNGDQSRMVTSDKTQSSNASKAIVTVLRRGPWLLAGTAIGVLVGRCLP